MFVKKWPLEYQKVTKTYLPTYVWDSTDSRDSSDGSDSSDSCDSNDSNDSNDSSDSSDSCDSCERGNTCISRKYTAVNGPAVAQNISLAGGTSTGPQCSWNIGIKVVLRV